MVAVELFAVTLRTLPYQVSYKKRSAKYRRIDAPDAESG
jgi:hypothetical protein